MTSTLPPAFFRGIEQFNQGEFYACHDTLEALWMDAIEPNKTFYQGILQIAVALYHLENLNWQGAVTLLGNGIHRLAPYQPDYEDIDVAALVAQAAQLLQQLQEAGADAVEAIAQRLTSSPAPSSSLPSMAPHPAPVSDTSGDPSANQESIACSPIACPKVVQISQGQ